MCCFVLPFAESPLPYKDRGSLDGTQGQKNACRFRRALLESCSGLIDKDYGFSSGNPCIIVKLNRIVNFRPRVSLLHVLRMHRRLNNLKIKPHHTQLLFSTENTELPKV